MKITLVQLKSTSPYSQSRYKDGDEKKRDQETHEEFERRTWHLRLHTTRDGFVKLPGQGFGNGIKSAAKRLGLRVPGKGQATYTKHFLSGVMVMDDVILSMRADDVESETLFVPSDGVKGSGKRVMKTFPLVPEWSAEVRFDISDDMINENVFRRVLHEFGMNVGIGRWRPETGGQYGRFKVTDLQWLEGDAAEALLLAS